MKTTARYLIYFGFCESSLIRNPPLWRHIEDTPVKAKFFYLVYGGREQKKTMDTMKKVYKECEWIQFRSGRNVKVCANFDFNVILLIFFMEEEHVHCHAFRWHQCYTDSSQQALYPSTLDSIDRGGSKNSQNIPT